MDITSFMEFSEIVNIQYIPTINDLPPNYTTYKALHKIEEDIPTTDEFKAQLNYQPNDRIIFNGNFGYRNEAVNTSTNASKFIGDFDLEYLLNQSGKLRAKVYSHTIDRSQLKEAKSTQGIGLIYKEDFASVSDMLSYYWNALTSFGTKKTNEDTNKTQQ